MIRSDLQDVSSRVEPGDQIRLVLNPPVEGSEGNKMDDGAKQAVKVLLFTREHHQIAIDDRNLDNLSLLDAAGEYQQMSREITVFATKTFDPILFCLGLYEGIESAQIAGE